MKNKKVSPVDAAAFAPPNLSIIRGEALRVDLEAKELEVKLLTGQGEGEEEGERAKTAKLNFDVLVAATGAVPKRLLPPSQNEDEPEDPRIVYLRDAESVAAAALSLRAARRVVVAGNGGIALGLAHALGSSEVSSSSAASAAAAAAAEEAESSGPLPPPPPPRRATRRQRRKVLWAAKHGHVGDAFFDVDAAAFLAKAIGKKKKKKKKEKAEEEAAVSGKRGPLPTSLVLPKGGAAPSSSSSSAPGSSAAAAAAAAPAFGAAVGPGWVQALTGPIGNGEDGSGGGEEEEEEEGEVEGEGGGGEGGEGGGEGEHGGGIDLHLNATVTSVKDNKEAKSSSSSSFPLLVTLSDDSPPFECDAVVSAVGVRPDTSWLPRELERSPADGGVLVDARMRSSFGPAVLACGDACTVRATAHGAHWFQMRLWSQARATGAAAGRSAAGFTEDGEFVEDKDGAGETESETPPLPPHSLELFAHATSVAGLRVIFLGLYNGQGLEGEPEEDIVTFCREEQGGESEEESGGGGGGGGGDGDGGLFVRVLLLRGRLAGAVLIGETGLEGVFEDLILDGLDVSFLGPRLLDPDLDLEAIFD